MNDKILIIAAIYEFIARILPTEKNQSIIDFLHYMVKRLVPNNSVYEGYEHTSDKRDPFEK